MPQRTSYAHGTPSWIDLATTDVAAARAFYGEIFGWTFEESDAGEGSVYTMAMQGGAPVAGMMDQPADMVAAGAPPLWGSYVSVDDIDATAAKVEAAGGQVMMPPMDVMTAGRMALIVEPGGAVLGLWQAGEHIGAGLVNEHGSLIWNELFSPDVPGAAAFYASVLGWGSEAMEMPGMDYTLFTVDGAQIAGGMAPPMEGMPSHWGVYLAVDDVDATVAKVRELGGAVMSEPMDTPPGRIAAIADPQGAMLMLMTPAGEAS